ncbi:hypothetical protein Clacol_009647 [Clathrus columnatus]|uniref:Uncharacterized protein n=1 Tax=Clathrus columnatus TaxID=1419009 RepID=A0AAV5AR69_9AGAM|nr:hypothetical protein Clacol_009647 [Clathrus columnatus]
MIALNAFATVTVHCLILRNGIFVPQTFQKGTSRQGNIHKFNDKYWSRSDGFPIRPPSNLPPSGNEHLLIALGEVLGSGRVGTVHHATLLTHHTELPPLIIKVSQHKWSENMEKEAWFYKELEQLQEIAIPRCYGFFQVHIEEGSEVLTWKVDSTAEYNGRNQTPEHPSNPTLLSILLLECLGERMPLRQPLDTIE